MLDRRARKFFAARVVAGKGNAVAALEVLEGRRLLAANPGSQPVELAAGYDTLFFTAIPNEFGTGREVFRSDGTEAGTFMVKDVATGISSSSARFFTPMGGAVYFRADGPPYISEEPGRATGEELWRTDGTPEGTRLVKDINPGLMASSEIATMVAIGNTLFFSAVDGVHGRELWKTDGTSQGTVLVKDLNPGSNGTPFYTGGVELNGKFIFLTGGYGSGPVRLWHSDGTEAGTYLLKDLALTWDGYPPLAVVGGSVYFTSEDAVFGRELWRTDGTVAGTQLVKDINPGTAASNPNAMAAFDGRLYFAADDGASGREVWSSDGTAVGTTPVSDVQPAGGTKEVGSLTAAGGRLAFAVSQQAYPYGVEVWRSDGTPGGTSRIGTVADAGGLPQLTRAGDTLFVTAYVWTEVGTSAWEAVPTLFSAHPAAGGLRPLRSFPGPFSAPVPMGDRIYFGATDPTAGMELWRSDGTPEGTVIVKDINLGGRSAMVTDKHLFYNDSAADGNDPAADARDDAAIATDKMPLWQNFTGTAENISNYSRGINGVMIDFSRLPQTGTLSADDFKFEIGGEGGTADSAWRAAPAPTAVAVRTLGATGVTRVSVIWADRAIYNTWLRVKVKPTANTGLAAPQVFYFGHLAGDAGPGGAVSTMASTAAAGGGRAMVDAWDVTMTARAQAGRNRTRNSHYDYNKDGWVNARDVAVVRSNYRRSLAMLSAGPTVDPIAPPQAAQSVGASAEPSIPPQRPATPMRRLVLA